MICKCTLQVRTYECDSNGHVNNANYLNYLEYARYEFLKDINFDYRAMVEAGYGVFVARIEIDYKKPAKTDDKLLLKTWPIKSGAVSGVLCQEIWREDPGKGPPEADPKSLPEADDLVAQAKVTWAFVDSKGMPAKLPAQWNVPGLKP